jgi:hypothetical protein
MRQDWPLRLRQTLVIQSDVGEGDFDETGVSLDVGPRLGHSTKRSFRDAIGVTGLGHVQQIHFVRHSLAESSDKGDATAR